MSVPSPASRPQAAAAAAPGRPQDPPGQQLVALQKVPLTATQRVADMIGVQPRELLDAVKAQCFGNDAAKVTDAAMMAFMSVAAEMRVNPLLPGMLYAFWNAQLGKFVPIPGPDAVEKALVEHPLYEGRFAEFGYEGDDLWCKVTISVKGWRHPITKTCYFSEWKMEKNPNWISRPRHMLELRTVKQAARQLIPGMPQGDEDDVIDVQFTQQQSVPAFTSAAPAVPAAAEQPAPRKKVEAAKKAEPPPEQVHTALPPGMKASPPDILADFRAGLKAMAKKENETEDALLKVLGSKRTLADFTDDNLDAVMEAQGLCEQYGWGPPP